MSNETLIEKIIAAESVIDPDAKPAIRYRVTVHTDSGQSDLWISKDAATELAAHLKALLGDDGSR
jgi:hypothetical protein